MTGEGKSSDKPQQEKENLRNEEEPQSLGFFQMVGSIMSSFLGVQSSKKSARDFKHGKASQFIAVGILMTIVWYGIISIIVNIVLANK